MPLFGPSKALFADLYQLTMAQAYWQSGNTGTATFSLFFRDYPPNRAYFVFAGLADILDYVDELRYEDHDIEYLRSIDLFDREFLEYLPSVRFTGSVRAMAEGTICFKNEPVIEVTAPVIEAQVLETFLVNQVNLQTILATKAARSVHAASGRPVVDFAARRTHGTEAAEKLARSCYMVGFAGTSNMAAGASHGIPTFGTMAHSFVTAFEEEIDAFRAYAKSFPDSSTFLVDTYDSIEGTKKAIVVAREMEREGHNLRAIRLDSGDLLDLARAARSLLDQAGLEGVQVFATGGLDERQIQELLESGAPIDGFGVGTKLGVSADAPWAECVYKMVEYCGRPVLKLSPDKETLPGSKQVYRLRDDRGYYAKDLIATESEGPPSPEHEPLLEYVVRDGRRLESLAPLEDLRETFAREFQFLADPHKGLSSPLTYAIETSQGLEALRSTLVHDLRNRDLQGPPTI